LIWRQYRSNFVTAMGEAGSTFPASHTVDSTYPGDMIDNCKDWVIATMRWFHFTHDPHL
jgi:hypothetical protein